jgi:hypothetical protein
MSSKNIIDGFNTYRNLSHSIPWAYENPPWFDSYSFENIDYTSWKHYLALNWTIPIWTTILYVVVIFSLQHWMKNRPPFKLQLPLAIWNLCIGLFSILGFIRIGRELWTVLSSDQYGFHTSVCTRIGLNEPMAYWSILMALSKFVELGDTIFIVLRKNPLILLQWYE